MNWSKRQLLFKKLRKSKHVKYLYTATVTCMQTNLCFGKVLLQVTTYPHSASAENGPISCLSILTWVAMAPGMCKLCNRARGGAINRSSYILLEIYTSTHFKHTYILLFKYLIITLHQSSWVTECI